MENYLFGELPFLSQTFDRVLFAPTDEFKYPESGNRVKDMPGIEVIKLNAGVFNLDSKERMKREKMVVGLFLRELVKSREKFNHGKRWKHLLPRLRQLYKGAHLLGEAVNRYNLKNTDTVFYHYWFYNGLVLTRIFHKVISEQRFVNIARAHSGDVYHSDFRKMQEEKDVIIPFEQIKWEEVDKVHVISSHGFNYLLAHFPQYRKKMTISRLGVFDNGLPISDGGQERKVIVTCSTVGKKKRLNLIPEIVHFMKFRVKWIHIGDANPESREILTHLMNTKCPGSEIEFTGFLKGNDLVRFYKENHVDLFANVSSFEGIPVTLMDAASFGIPMLATTTTGNPEIVNEENGLLVPVDFNPEVVAHRIDTLFSDVEASKKKSLAARKMFETTYNADVNYAVFAAALLSYLKKDFQKKQS
ncbi:MAG: glycosyltransferase [Crocinitomicaceae bacterium]|nr:glycosyltransferase [Crocinitomicaceae bacterium]